jgi:hypothetical protein
MANPDDRAPAGLGAEHNCNDSYNCVRNVVSRLEGLADRDQVPLRDLVESCGNASFVPALMVPALLVVSPLSGIPLFSSLCGITIALISVQMLWKRDHLSLPEFVVRRQVSGQKLRAAFKRMRRAADFIDRHTHDDRFHRLVGRGGRVVPQILCMIAGVLMPVLEIVPFSSSILGAAVLCFSVSLLTRDGLFVVFGMAIMAAVALLPLFVLNAT